MTETAIKHKLYKCVQCGRKTVILSDPTRKLLIAKCEPCGGNFLRLVLYSPWELDTFVKAIEELEYL